MSDATTEVQSPDDLVIPSLAAAAERGANWALIPPDVPAEPPPELRYRPVRHLAGSIMALLRSRGIIWSLTVRDLRSTYSQEVLGLAWALLAPVTLMVVFTFLQGRLGGAIDTGGVWYPIFAYVGILPWTFFANAVSGGGTSLVGNPLLNKVYAPREVFPIAKIFSATVTLLCAAFALAILFVIDGRLPSVTFYWTVPLMVILLVFTFGITLFISGVTVYLRDMRHAIPLLLQLGLFLTPIIYGMDEIPEQWRKIYVAVNPVAAVIDGMRRCLLYNQIPNLAFTGIAAVAAVVWLLGAFLLFKRLETGFADVS